MASARGAMTFDEVQDYLGEVVDALPQGILDELNGGIVMRRDIVLSPGADGVFTLGNYHYEPMGLGRYIIIHYGSFLQVYGHRPPAAQKKALRDLLHHELTHHIESLAGVRDLEDADERQMAEYRRRREPEDEE